MKEPYHELWTGLQNSYLKIYSLITFFELFVLFCSAFCVLRFGDLWFVGFCLVLWCCCEQLLYKGSALWPGLWDLSSCCSKSAYGPQKDFIHCAKVCCVASPSLDTLANPTPETMALFKPINGALSSCCSGMIKVQEIDGKHYEICTEHELLVWCWTGDALLRVLSETPLVTSTALWFAAWPKAHSMLLGFGLWIFHVDMLLEFCFFCHVVVTCCSLTCTFCDDVMKCW